MGSNTVFDSSLITHHPLPITNMTEKVLMKGNEALAEAAVLAGCTLYFGHPITPQSEIPEYMSRRLPKIEGGAYIQAETEVSAINMVYGAAATGRRAMTTSSSPGVSLMMEGISWTLMDSGWV